MKLRSEILTFLNRNFNCFNQYLLKSISLDSRKCDPESVFIAIKGSTTDGNKYIQDVISKGIKLVLTDNKSYEQEYTNSLVVYIDELKNILPSLAMWFYDYKKPQSIIGITGTNGKTSISSYIAQMINLCNQKALLLGTNGNGIYPALVESTHTTLDILSLYEIISSYKNYKNLVMEVSSHALDQNRIEGLDFDIAVFSNLSHDHLDYHLSMENYFQAKAKLFKLDSLKKAVINIDDKYGERLCNVCTCRVVKVSLQSKVADIFLKNIKIEGIHTSFDLYIYQKYIGRFTTQLIAEFNLTNLALAIGVLYEQVSIKEILENISNVIPVKGRMETIELSNKARVVIDYAHTPDALEKVLQTLKNYTDSKLWCVFGCGGDRDTTKRAEMAGIAEKYADNIVVTEDNSRFENIESIFADIKKGFKNTQEVEFIGSREEAIKYAVREAKVQDIILLAGKGHECYIDKKGVKMHFDEREVISKCESGEAVDG